MKILFEPGQRIGLDKLTLSNLRVNNINFDRLRQTKAEINLFPPGNRAIRDNDHGMPVKRIIIRDNCVFSDLIIGCAGDGNRYIHEYVYLTLTVTHARGDNIRNLSWCEYDYYLGCVCDYIIRIYGISLDPASAKINKIEINCNITLSAPYQDYFRVLSLLASWAPKTFYHGGKSHLQRRGPQIRIQTHFC